jgi:signal transduction histidine kinase
VRLWRVFITGRTIVTGVLLGLLYVVNAFYVPRSLAPLFAVVGVQFGLNALYLLLWKRRDLVLLSYLCFVIEIVLITLMILNFGVDGYIFVLAYFWPIVMAGRLIGQTAILPLTLLSTILYATIIMLQRQGLVFHGNILLPDGTPQALFLSLPYLVFVSLLLWALTSEVAHGERDLYQRNLELGRTNTLLHNILAHMSEGVFLVDQTGQVLLGNRGAMALLRLQEGQRLPEQLARQLKPADSAHHPEERTLIELNGRAISLSRAAIPAGSFAASTVYVARDVTQELQLERSKSEFLAYASHELRTPLTTIKTMVRLLLMDEPSNSKRHDYLTIIDTQVERQTRMVRNLLDLTRLEAGRYELPSEEVDPGGVLRSTVQAMGPLAQAKGLDIRLDCGSRGDLPPTLVSNASGIEQVLMNLLSNAIKFTEQGTITVRCGRSADRVWIAVEDTGIGMTTEQTERIFTKFYTVEHPRKRGEGTGLGLVISQMIMRELGGSIEVCSRPGQGTRFTVFLPLDKDAVAQRSGRDAQSPERGGEPGATSDNA